METLMKVDLPGFKPRRGKVRDIFDLGPALLMVASDRISAFDCIMPNGIPDKGKVLNQLSEFWFANTSHIIKNHLITTDMNKQSLTEKYADILTGRSMLVVKTNPLPVKCIVRGYITGSGWKDYKRTGAISGIKLPAGLRESEKLDKPIFTPSIKVKSGHDENISFKQMKKILQYRMLAEYLRNISFKIYSWAHDYAEQKGIIIADTKFKFGLKNGELYLIDELLTPDSSQFWPADDYDIGRSQKSFDKQYVREYLESTGWDKTPPAPKLPADVVKNTQMKYLEALRLLTGKIL